MTAIIAYLLGDPARMLAVALLAVCAFLGVRLRIAEARLDRAQIERDLADERVKTCAANLETVRAVQQAADDKRKAAEAAAVKERERSAATIRKLRSLPAPVDCGDVPAYIAHGAEELRGQW
jgi:hypothetical protein